MGHQEARPPAAGYALAPWASTAAPEASAAAIAVSASSRCELALITGRAQFEALELEWNALFARAGRAWQIFQTFNWLWHWANDYLDGRSRLAICLTSGRCSSKRTLRWEESVGNTFGSICTPCTEKV